MDTEGIHSPYSGYIETVICDGTVLSVSIKHLSMQHGSLTVCKTAHQLQAFDSI